jgi:hypothetical protein
MGLIRKLVGNWRLWRGYCPECNSDAPDVDTCEVCEGYYGPPWPSSHLQLELWRRRWLRLEAIRRQGRE